MWLFSTQQKRLLSNQLPKNKLHETPGFCIVQLLMQTLDFVIIINDAVMIRGQKNYSDLNRQELKYELYYYNVVYVKDENSIKT